MQNRLIVSILAMVAVFTTLPVIFAQTAKQPVAAKARKAPSTPDLSGVWFQRQGSGVGALTKEPLPMQPWVEAKAKSLKHEIDDPTLLCLPPGVPRILTNPQPMELIQIPGRLLILYETDHLVRQIWTDGRKLPEDPDPTWMGRSVGRWDGDTLVVDTIGLTDRSWLDNEAHMHSDALHVVERIRRVDHDTLQFDVTIDDPKAYTKPWTGQRVLKLRPGWEIMESVCMDNPETNKKLMQAGK